MAKKFDTPLCGKYPFTQDQIKKVDAKKTAILSRANLFANDKHLHR